VILGTAGHIDHGKTSLVRALTGVDTDRLPEEKRRGITIALGFAPLVLEGVGTIGVVDVPGHEAFVRTMLAGASGIDLALLVIAADEGVRTQTREHLAILTLLGVRAGVVALTKSDLVDDDLRELAAEEVRAAIAGSTLADAPIVPVSAATGAGLDALRAAIRAAAALVPARAADDPWRMPVDRVFSVAGAGTVVTGTAWTGTIARDADVRILPLDRTARVRSVESHGAAARSVAAGSRVALALVGVDRDEVAHDAVLVSAGDRWEPSRVLRADVALLPHAPAVSARRWLRFHLGTADVGARLIAVGGPLSRGETRAVRILLDAPVVMRAGDRFVLRAGGSDGTIGGGVVTDPLPPSRRAKPWPATGASDLDRLQWMLDESAAGGLPVAPLALRLGLRPALVERLLKELEKVVRIDDRLVRLAVLASLRATLMTLVERTHTDQPLAPGVDRQAARAALSPDTAIADEVIRRAERAGLIVVEGATVRLVAFQAGAGEGATSARDRLLDRLRAAGVEPPGLTELVTEFGPEVPALLKLLDKEKRIVMVALDRPFAREGVVELLARLRAHVSAGRAYSPAELRDALGISRKWLIPFLEWCDRQRISLRRDDGRTFGTVPENP